MRQVLQRCCIKTTALILLIISHHKLIKPSHPLHPSFLLTPLPLHHCLARVCIIIIIIMLHLILLAALAIKPSTAASLPRMQPQMDADACCPCPAPGTPGGEATTVTVIPPTVTVTEPAAPPATETVYISHGNGLDPSKETLTVEHTVTEDGNTVYVTKGQQSRPLTHYVTQGVPSEPQPSPQTVTVQVGGPQLSDEMPGEQNTVTKTIGAPQPSDETPGTEDAATETVPGDMEEGPVTVTVGVEPVHDTTVTITPGGPAETVEGPKEVTVTVSAKPSQETPQQGTDDQVLTKTVHGDEGEPHTVIVSLQPSIKTVTIGSSNILTETNKAPEYVTVTAVPEEETVSVVQTIENSHALTKTDTTPQYLTVTAAPEGETVSVVQTVDHYQTLTKTCSTGGSDNIEITIININTGEQTCEKKHSGKPCDDDDDSTLIYTPAPAPQTTVLPCPSPDASTSFQTVYNTILVTGTAGVHYNATAKMGYAQPSGTGIYPVNERKPKAPLTKWW